MKHVRNSSTHVRNLNFLSIAFVGLCELAKADLTRFRSPAVLNFIREGFNL